MHHRFAPKEHRFAYNIFMFCLDLGELPELEQKLRWFSRNRWNLYSFHDRDHLTLSSVELLQNVREYAASQGLSQSIARVLFVTMPRVLGYIFNPASFYFCFDEADLPLASIVQVGNTFGEMKLFFLKETPPDQPGHFVHQETKYFYVSPFFDHDLQFAFDLRLPGDRLVMQIDDYESSKKVLHTTLTGEKRELSDRMLVRLTWKYPLVTLKVILGIHWEAWKLWRKGLSFHRKSDHAHLQKNIHRVNVGSQRGRTLKPKTIPVSGETPAGLN